VTLDGLPDWSFEVTGVSMGVYRARGTNTAGWTIEFTTTSEANLVVEVKEAVREMTSRNLSGGNQTGE
jgi:hypothetical protein